MQFFSAAEALGYQIELTGRLGGSLGDYLATLFSLSDRDIVQQI